MKINNKGYIALTAILIIVAATLAVAISANFLSIDSGKNGLTLDRGDASFSLGNGCIEEAIIRLQRNGAYTGGSLNTTAESCTITVAAQGAQRTITAITVADSITRTLTAHVTLTPTFSFDWWQEE